MSAVPALRADLPDEAFAASLSGVPYLYPRRLRQVLHRLAPRAAWVAVTTGRSTDPVVGGFLADLQQRGQWRPPDRRLDPELVWRRCAAAEVKVHLFGGPDYPADLADDLEAPAVLFSRGDPGVLHGRRVAIVGTRNATAAGREIAAELGADLARHDVRVVSGLARGIDGWAHRGALRAGGAPPVGVVACGLDVVYPSEHRQLWAMVAEQGLLLGEVPPGIAPVGYRFPLRNRILAALAEVLVVVESRARGGSLLTVEEAIKRGVPVLAVPGSPRNTAAEGTNRLISEGCQPVLDATDVLVALGLAGQERGGRRPDLRPVPEPDDQAILELFGADPLDMGRVVELTSRPVMEVAIALARLEAMGWVGRTAGWYERLGPPGSWP